MNSKSCYSALILVLASITAFASEPQAWNAGDGSLDAKALTSQDTVDDYRAWLAQETWGPADVFEAIATIETALENPEGKGWLRLPEVKAAFKKLGKHAYGYADVIRNDQVSAILLSIKTALGGVSEASSGNGDATSVETTSNTSTEAPTAAVLSWGDEVKKMTMTSTVEEYLAWFNGKNADQKYQLKKALESHYKKLVEGDQNAGVSSPSFFTGGNGSYRYNAVEDPEAKKQAITDLYNAVQSVPSVY